ncbi:MAG TPA: L,D-transpeptidase [Flavitalea sp.]|nr:L,D-transpeptidase [Flavitalea sp.]
MKTKIIGIFLLAITTGLIGFRTVESRFVKRSLFNESPNGTIYILIDKSDYEVRVYDDEGWYATYPAVFGNKSLEDKMMEGDRNTPEGNFKIVLKKPHEKWHKMAVIDYPNKESWQKFNQRKAEGLIPKNARIGGGIAIHGTWPNDNIVVDDFTNWTEGCISIKNNDIDELFSYLPVGTRVTIRK